MKHFPYTGSGPYCYSNAFAMMLGEISPPTNVIEFATSSAFGMHLLRGTLPFFDPFCWTPEGPLEGKEVVVALGPWADTVTRKLGYRFPLAVKRGYHMHYGTEDGAKLNNWVLDAECGYFLAPMQRGIRLTTGAEFAKRDTRKTPAIDLGQGLLLEQFVELVGRLVRAIAPLRGWIERSSPS